MHVATYLINLDRDKDRLAHMSRELARIGLVFERIPAVAGLAMPDWLKPDFLDAEGSIASRLKPGEVGCYASHLVAAHRLLKSGEPYALVLEDDLRLPDDLVPLLQQAIAALPQGWDILRLSNPPKAPYRALMRMLGGRHLAIYARVPNNTGAQLISRSGAEKLLAGGKRRLPIDEHLRRPWMMGLETYGIAPAPIVSNIFDSTIDAMGDRALGRESFLTKLNRRHWPDPAEFAAQIRWQLTHLGAGGYLRALFLGAAWSIAKRVSPRLAERIASHFVLLDRR